MPSKVPLEPQHSGDKEVPMPTKDSGVPTALSAGGLSSRVSGKMVDVGPEHPKPLPTDVEVSTAKDFFHLRGQSRSGKTVLYYYLRRDAGFTRELPVRSGLALHLLRNRRSECSC